MVKSSEPSKKRTSKVIQSSEIENFSIETGLFDRVSGSTYKLKPAHSKSFYVLCNIIANEFKIQREGLRARNDGDLAPVAQRSLYLQHAESSLRMLAERMLKSFRMMDIVAAINVAGPLWAEAVERVNKNHSLKSA